MKRISVVVPVYNSESTLEKCIASVIGQTFSDWELVLVDDGSTDSSGKICDSYASSDSRIKVLHRENGGVSKARNDGISAASGEYIAFLDADDWLSPECYEVLLRLLDESASACVACANKLSYPDGSERVEKFPIPAGVYSEEAVRQKLVLPLLCDRLSPNPVNGYVVRYLFSKARIEELQLRFSGAYLEDELFLIEYFAAGQSLAVTDMPLYCYFQNPASVTRRYMAGFENVFFNSLAIKETLVEKYSLPVSETWRENSSWAGLLMAVGNEFAPGNPASFSVKLRKLKELCRTGDFARAVKKYKAGEVQGNKRIVVSLIRKKLYLLLALLYTVKNRNRGK